MWKTRLGRFHFITNLEILSPPNQVQNVLDWYGFDYADFQLNKGKGGRKGGQYKLYNTYV